MSSSQQTWNKTLPDTSPMFIYSPYSDGIGLTEGWQAGYSVSGFLTSAGESGSGDSFHMTSLPGASVQLQFFGTGISLSGIANCSYSIILDSTQQSIGSPSYGTLYTTSGLENTSHNVTLVGEPSTNQTLQFEGATVSAPASGIPTTLQFDNTNTTAVSYDGNWTISSNSQIPNSTEPSPYHRTTDGTASATFNFTGRAVEIRGVSNYGWWTYLITLDGEIVQPTKNASSFWIIPDAVLFYQDGLNETVTHTIKIDNDQNEGMVMALNSFTAYQFNTTADSAANSTSSSSGSGSGSDPGGNDSHLSSGAIAGIVIGSITGLALILITLFAFQRRRQYYEGIQAMARSSSPLDSSPQNYDRMPHESKIQAYNLTKENAEIPGASYVQSYNPPSSSPASHTHSEPVSRLLFDASFLSPVERQNAAIRQSSPPQAPQAPMTSDMSQSQSSPPQHPAQRALPSPPTAYPTDQKRPAPLGTGSEPEARSDARSDSTPSSAVERMADVLVDRIVARLGHDAEGLRPPPEYEDRNLR